MTVFVNDVIKFESVSAVTATPDVAVGTYRREGDEEYIYVYNACNSDIPPSYGCILSAVSGYSVSLSSVTDTGFGVGIIKHATLTTGTYGWMMIKGFAQFEMGADNSCAAGVNLSLGTDGVFAARSISTGVLGNAPGVAMSATASSLSGTGFFRF
jgi:hypothetical protein